MMLLVFCLVVYFSQTHGNPLELLGNDAEWQIWKEFHGKSYENEFVENYRKAIWIANLEVGTITDILDTLCSVMYSLW